MTTAIALFEPIPLPARSNPARLPCLPVWLERRVTALANVHQPDPQKGGGHRQAWTLPKGMILGSSERAAVAEHVAALSVFLDPSRPITIRERELSNDEGLATLIAGLLMQAGRQDAAISETRAESYLDAIEDLPAWSVREAIRKWNRGDSQQLDKQQHDFRWPPAPATLRRLAWVEIAHVRARITTLNRLLNAEELIEYSAEHRNSMLDRLGQVMKLFKPERAESPH